MNRQTMNPYLPGWEYIPDGEPKLFDGRVYIFGSHDEARGERYCTGDYVTWSAPADDLSAWTYEGVIWRVCDDPDYADTEPGEVLYFAPDCTKGPDGRYYLFYFSSRMEKIGVAVCDTPGGHYRFYGNVKWPDGRTFSSEDGFGLLFDPGILSDESGNWLYYGYGLKREIPGFPKAGAEGGFAVGLEDDMLTIKAEPKRTIPGRITPEADIESWGNHTFQEASSIRHYNGMYYLVYSGEEGHDLCYAVSKYPDRDFEYGGVIISNGDVGLKGRTEENAVGYIGNNHGGLLQIADQYYIFYHRHTHGIQYSRQGCIERVEIREDGSIPQVEITTQGASGVPLTAKNTEYSAHHACFLRSGEGILHYSGRVHWNDMHPYISQEAEDRAATLQNQFIYNMKNNAVCGFKYLFFDGTETALELRVRGNFTGMIELVLDDPEGKAAAQVKVEPKNKWTWVKTETEQMPGSHAVYFRFVGTGSCDFDAFRFSAE